MIKIGRLRDGVSVNGIEYLLDNLGKEREFRSVESAKMFLLLTGCYEADFDDFVFEEQEIPEQIIRCNQCMTVMNETDIEIENDEEKCPKCGDGSALMDLYKAKSLRESELNKWILTDVDTMQYVKRLSVFEFMVKQPVKSHLFHAQTEYHLRNGNVDHDDESKWITETYDFTKIPVSELYNYIEGYYRAPEDVFSMYGSDALQIFAECAFEYEMEV